jgi:DNA-binding winged helix-turn-helix (wHTH) protein/CheY-like chemotaxis protein
MHLAMNAFPQDLLVDDGPDIQRLLASLRAGREHGTASRADGSALAASREPPPADILLIDLTPARQGDALRCRVLRPSSDLSALILKVVEVVEEDATPNPDDDARARDATPSSDDDTRARDAAPTSDDDARVGLAEPESLEDLVARALAIDESYGSFPASINPPTARTARFAGWTLDLERHRLSLDEGLPTALPHTEFALLLAFLEHPLQVLTRDELVAHTRGTTRYLSVRTVDVYVSRLRRRLSADRSGLDFIETRHKQGYLFNADAVFA